MSDYSRTTLSTQFMLDHGRPSCTVQGKAIRYYNVMQKLTGLLCSTTYKPSFSAIFLQLVFRTLFRDAGIYSLILYTTFVKLLCSWSFHNNMGYISAQATTNILGVGMGKWMHSAFSVVFTISFEFSFFTSSKKVHSRTLFISFLFLVQGHLLA